MRKEYPMFHIYVETCYLSESFRINHEIESKLIEQDKIVNGFVGEDKIQIYPPRQFDGKTVEPITYYLDPSVKAMMQKPRDCKMYFGVDGVVRV